MQDCVTLEQGIKKLKNEALKNPDGTILSCTIKVVQKTGLLKKQKQYPKLYWKGKESDQQYFCWGISSFFSTLDDVNVHSDFPSFAVFAFDREHEQWPGFPSQQIWQPLWCLRTSGSESILYHVVSENKPLETRSSYDIPKNQHLPNHQSWTQTIATLKQELTQKKLAKIVISRQSCAKTNDVWSIFDTLTNQQPDCYHFLYAPEVNSAFLGCSPERLFSISKNKLFTEAIAGTRPIAFAPVEDAHLDRELQNSNKDNVEHNIVTQFISSALEKYSTKILIEPRRILRLKNVKHLQTPIIATLKDSYSMDELLNSLHPTPAVCGYPRNSALEKIRSIENFSRGWYSGTIGILLNEKSDFTVAIRSALVQKSKLFIWAGAGIVADSNPTEEWQEVNAKAKQFFDLAEQ